MTANRVQMRPLQSDDVQYLYRWYNDPKLMETFGSAGDPFSISMEGVAIRVKALMEDQNVLAYLVFDPHREGPLGLCALKGINRRNASATIMVYMGSEEWREERFCKEVLTSIIEVGFSVLNLHRLEARVQDHQRSFLECLVECGFRSEGNLREDHFRGGEWRDTILLSLLNGEEDL